MSSTPATDPQRVVVFPFGRNFGKYPQYAKSSPLNSRRG